MALLLVLAACQSDTEPSTRASGTEPAGEDAPRDKKGKEDASATCPEPGPQAEAGSAVPFEDVTEEAGLVDPLLGMFGHATASADVDGDGWLDLFVGTFADKPEDRYRERGASGRAPDRLMMGGPEGFELAEGFPEPTGRSSGAAFADLDGDGDPDLVVARNLTGDGADGEDTVVMRNDGGDFEVVGHPAPGLAARGVAPFDYDGDGRLDVFIVGEQGGSVLVRNEGDLELTDVTDDAGLPGDIAGYGVTAADLTADGRPDLVVAGSNRIFVNTGGAFEEADASELAWEAYGDEDIVTGVAVGDVNRDGRPDLVLGQHYNSTLDRGCRVPVRLYLHRGVEDGQPVFEDVTEAAGLPAFATKASHVEVADFDNDGWPDLLTTASADDGGRPAVLLNQGLGDDGVPRFAVPPGLGDPQYWVTGVSADFDGDGLLDVFAVEFEPSLPSRLWRNASEGGHWLDVEVVPDATGVGTVVEAYRPGGAGDPDALVARAEVIVGQGYGAGSPPVAHLGLGDVGEVDLILRPAWSDDPLELKGRSVDGRLRIPDDIGG